MKRVVTLRQLRDLADEKRAVIVPESHPWKNPRPAAVLLHQQGSSLLRLMEMGMYIYEPQTKEDKS